MNKLSSTIGQPTADPHTDALTGAKTRAVFDDVLHAFTQNFQQGKAFSLAVMDVDYLKRVNDSFGHARGDQVIKAAAQCMASVLRKDEILVRYGGDEFVVFLARSFEASQHLLQHMLQQANALVLEGNPPLQLSLSIGLASATEVFASSDLVSGPEAVPQALFELADFRTLRAKRIGRNQVVATGSTQDDTDHKFTGRHFKDELRLIERDNILARAGEFFQHLVTHKRGTLRVQGPPGAGHSRLIDELVTLARLQHFKVLHITATPAYKYRAFAALDQSLQAKLEQRNVAPVICGGAMRQQVLQDVLATHEQVATNPKRDRVDNLAAPPKQGVIVLVDRLDNLDVDTVALLSQMLRLQAANKVDTSVRFTDDAVLGVIYSTLPATRGLRLEHPLNVELDLEPLSLQGSQMLLQSLLHKVVPNTLAEWFLNHTQGLPKHLVDALHALESEAILQEDAAGWRFNDYEAFDLASHLTQVHKSTLPPSHDYFVGRSDDIAQIKAALEQRIVTIVGIGGIGKSHVALQVARELNRSSYSEVNYSNVNYGEVRYIPLAGLRSAKFLPLTIASALELTVQETQHKSLETHLCERLGAHQVLLVLDNYEHLLPDTQLLSWLLDACPNLSVIVTSRQRLGLAGEQVVQLAGLDYPDTVEDNHFQSYSAVQLFINNAKALARTTIMPADYPHVLAIVQALQGMPLALELVASWLATFSLETTKTKVLANLTTLDSASTSSAEQSLEAAVSYFWQQLSSSEQSVVQRLSVFKGGFEAAAAAHVADASPFLLQGLIDRAFLRFANGRYSIHELLRQFAARKLADHPRRQRRAKNCHANYYAQIYTSPNPAQPQFTQAQSARAQSAQTIPQANTPDFLALEQDLNNFRAGWFWLLDVHNYTLLANYVRLFSNLLEFRGQYSLACQLFEAAEQKLTDVPPDPARDAFLGELYGRYSWLLRNLGQFAKGQTYVARSLALLEPLGVSEALGDSYYYQGYMLRAKSKYDAAISSLEASLQVAKTLGNQRLHANALRGLGFVAHAKAEFQTALEYYQHALEHYHDTGDVLNVLVASNLSGHVTLALGDVAAAQTVFERADALALEHNALSSRPSIQHGLGDVAYLQADYARAKKHYQISFDLSLASQAQYRLSTICRRLADIALQENDYGHAQTLLQQSYQHAQATGTERSLFFPLVGFVRLWLATGHYDHALELVAYIHNHPSPSRNTLDEACECVDTLKDLIGQVRVEAALSACCQDDLLSYLEHTFPKLQNLTNDESPEV